MNVNHLQFALAVARLGSFTRASDACCVTQPTLSNGIKKLEHQLGAALFKRTTRKVSLTPFGTHMMPAIQGMDDAQRELNTSAQLFFEPNHRLLAIGFSPLVDMRIIDAIVAPFTQSNDSLHTHYKECYIDVTIERLLDGQIDAALRPAVDDPAVRGQEYASLDVYREPIFVIPRDDPACRVRGQGALSVEDAADELFALTPNICGHANATRGWFADEGIKIKEYPGQAVSYQVMQDWAKLGLASAILPWSKIAPEHRVRARPLINAKRQPVSLGFELLWCTETASSQPLADFLSHCQDRVAGLIDGLHIEDELFTATQSKPKAL